MTNEFCQMLSESLYTFFVSNAANPVITKYKLTGETMKSASFFVINDSFQKNIDILIDFPYIFKLENYIKAFRALLKEIGIKNKLMVPNRVIISNEDAEKLVGYFKIIGK